MERPHRVWHLIVACGEQRGNMFERRHSRDLFAPICLILTLLCSTAFSQSQEKPKLKDFGRSLKRLKWDPKLNRAVTKSKAQNPATGEDDVVRVETNLVVSDLLVLDARGNPVPGLSEKDFAITEDEAAQKVGIFTLGDSTTISRSVVLIIDYSGSQSLFIQTSIAAAKSMVDKLGPSDRLAIVTDDVELIQDFTTDKTRLKKKLGSLLDRFDPNPSFFKSRRLGLSKQYSALMATLNEAFNAEDQRPIVIFQTDGDQLKFLRNAPQPLTWPAELQFSKRDQKMLLEFIEARRTEFSIEDIFRASEKSGATIYTIVSGTQYLGLSQEEQMKRARIDSEREFAQIGTRPSEQYMSPAMLRSAVETQVRNQSALAAVASATGGWTMFLETPSQADEIYSRILSDINRRYIIGYYPTNKEHDGKRRRINITVPDHPDYTIVSRRWYYAPGPDQ